MDALLELVRRGHGEQGIYALAQRAGRPYRRVYSHVQSLANAGFVTLSRSQAHGRSVVRVRPVQDTPKLSFNRAWSRPDRQIDADTFIAGVLKRPTFSDLLTCVQCYGLNHVNSVYRAMLLNRNLSEEAASDTARMLKNIEIGYGRAARKHA
jgi:predicted transcriptional regulator